MPTSQNGFPAGDRSVIHNPKVPGTGIDFPGGLRRGPAGDLLIWVATQVHHRVENGGTGYGMWGYAYRAIRGGSRLSNHASGTAIDWHAPRHPLGRSGTFNAAQVREIHQILAEARGCVRWGGDYSGRKDEMHFEIVASEAACARALAAVSGGGGGAAPTGRPVLRNGDTGPAVTDLQARLGITADGIFGDGTEAAVRAFQSSHGLTVDGIVGAATWAALDADATTTKGLPLMIDRPLVAGFSEGRIICPTGSASGLVSRAWVSASLDKGGRVEMWFQKGAWTDGPPPGAGDPVDWTLKNGDRAYVQVPDGTEYIHYRVTAEGPGALLIEQEAK